MENASKAILIAGGVLLALVVISICMLVISNAKESFVSMEERRQAQIVQEQTVKFANYVGQPIYGTEVYNCIKRAQSYNANNPGSNIVIKNDSNKNMTVPDAVTGIYPDIIVATEDLTNVENRNKIFEGEMVTNPDGTIQSIKFKKWVP